MGRLRLSSKPLQIKKFDSKAGNGEIFATGEGCKAKASCMNGIKSIRKNADSQIVEKE